MPVEKLKRFLAEEGVEFETLPHEAAYTAQEVAASAHVPGKELAKTVMVKIDGAMAMVVLPADDRVDLDLVREAAEAGEVELADEDEFAGLFPSCEPGAMPPFGNLWGMEVFADPRLAEDEKIAFNAGTHTELVRLTYTDFERLVGPRVANVSARGAAAS